MVTPEELAHGFREWLRGAGVTLNTVDLTWEELTDEVAALLRKVKTEERQMSVTVCSNYNVMKKQLGSAESPDAANLAETFRYMLAELTTPAPGDGVK